MLRQEATNADLIRSHAEATRTDTRLRAMIVHVLCGLIVVAVLGVMVMAALQAWGVVKSTDLLRAAAGPGGIIAVLAIALGIMLRRR